MIPSLLPKQSLNYKKCKEFKGEHFEFKDYYKGAISYMTQTRKTFSSSAAWEASTGRAVIIWCPAKPCFLVDFALNKQTVLTWREGKALTQAALFVVTLPILRIWFL